MQMAAEKIVDDPIGHFTEAERLVLRAKESIKVSAWAEKYRHVTRGPAPGKWRNDLTPYCIEPMDAFTLPWVRKIYLQFPPQSGKTQIALNCLSYAIDVDPGPAMYIMPDEKVAKRISRRQIIPTFRESSKIAALLGPRADDVTTLNINFINGMDLTMAWASSAAVMASESIRYIFGDEPGKYPEYAGREADPFSLAEQRTNAYQYTSKEMWFTTPALDGDAFDTIIKNEVDERRIYNARCPFCKKLQVMDFERITWQGKRDYRVVLRKKLARYACVKCGMEWDDYLRDKAVRAGRYVAEKPVERPLSILFYLPGSWYSPFISLSKPASNFLKAQEDPRKYQAFFTQDKVVAWKEVVEKKEDKEILKHRSQLPAGIVPAWAVALVAAIDVQKRGFWFIVRAFGPDLTSHLVQYGYLSTFDDVEQLVFNTNFQIEDSDNTMKIWRAPIDTGGGESDDEFLTRTEEIYEFVRAMQHKRGRRVVFAVKGNSRRQITRVNPPRAIDKMPKSNKVIKGGIELRMLDTFEFKKLLHWRLTRREEKIDDAGNVTPAESQRFYLHADTGMEYVKQFLAEELRRDRKGKYEWKKIRRDNHLLDCEVMVAAAADNSWMPSLQMIAKKKSKKEQKEVKKEQKEVKKSPAANNMQQAALLKRKQRGSSNWMNI